MSNINECLVCDDRLNYVKLIEQYDTLKNRYDVLLKDNETYEQQLTEKEKEIERLKAEIATLPAHDEEVAQITRERVCGLAEVDLRSLIQAFAGSLTEYCIWNKKNDGDNFKIFQNMIRTIQKRESKVLELFDERLNRIKKG